MSSDSALVRAYARTYVCARDLQPGMVVTSISKRISPPPSYLILGARNTPENRVKLKVHILGHDKPLAFEITLEPSVQYIQNNYTIEESPL